MLPQGRFQAFLRAESEERHKLLQQLFRTARFEDVERWLRDRRRSPAPRVARATTTRWPTWSAGSARPPHPRCPTSWDLHDLGPPAETGEVAPMVGLPATGSRGGGATRPSSRAGPLSPPRQRRARPWTAARQLRDAQQRHADALAERDRLAAAAPDHARQVDRLARARRAAAVLPLGRIADQQAQAAARAHELSADPHPGCGRPPGARRGRPRRRRPGRPPRPRGRRGRRRPGAPPARGRPRCPASARSDAACRARTPARGRARRARPTCCPTCPPRSRVLRERESAARDAERDLPGVAATQVGSLRGRREAAAARRSGSPTS